MLKNLESILFQILIFVVAQARLDASLLPCRTQLFFRRETMSIKFDKNKASNPTIYN